MRKGDKVLVWGENRPEWIVCYWGCLLLGVVVVPIDYRSSPAFASRVRGVVDASVVVVGDEVQPFGDAFAGAEIWRLAELDWNADGPVPQVEITRDDLTQIIFTSGATAEPKGVVIRHRNVLANVVPVEREVLKYRAYARPFLPLRFVNLLPLSHMFGQSMATNIPPMVRGTVIFTRSLNPHDVIDLIRSRRVSVLVCVPKILDVLREHVLRHMPEAAEGPPAGTSIPVRWWRYRRVHRAFGPKFWAFVVGAAPLPADLEEFWRRMGFAVIQGYGLTETAPIVTLNHPFKTSKGSVGTPIAGVELRIAEDGEILVRGENVTSGYYGDAEGALAADGWLHTGDIGARDEQGRVFIKGRKKEMIVTPDGLNVFPEDVERVVDAQPGVRESAVVGVTEGAQERVHAVVVLDAGADLDAVIRGANAALQDHQRIRTASAWTTGGLPRTEGTRKLRRAAIHEWVATGARPVTAATADSVESLLQRFTHGRRVNEGTTIDELGLSSLERVELMVALEDSFQVRFDEARFAQAASVAQLKELVAARPEGDTRGAAGGLSVVEPAVARLAAAPAVAGAVDSAARPRVRARPSRRPRTPGGLARARSCSHRTTRVTSTCPVILAALPGRLRARVAPAMAKEFFKAHFFPEGQPWRARLSNSLNYYLASFFFNAFPIPQREAGARQTLKYIGELTGGGWSVLIFPEGLRSSDRRHQAVPRRHRHDRVTAGRAGGAGADRRRGPHPADRLDVCAARPGARGVRGAPGAARGRLRRPGRTRRIGGTIAVIPQYSAHCT